MLEEKALDYSNIAGFDHEIASMQEIKKEVKQEVKIEPVDQNIDEGSNNDETKNVGDGDGDVSKFSFENENRISIKNEKKLDIFTQLTLLSVDKKEDCIILTKVLESLQKKSKWKIWTWIFPI